MRNTGVKGKSKILTGAIEGWSCHTEMGRRLAQTLVNQEKAYKDLQDSTGNSTQYFAMTCNPALCSFLAQTRRQAVLIDING